jgi:hypothetical protein
VTTLLSLKLFTVQRLTLQAKGKPIPPHFYSGASLFPRFNSSSIMMLRHMSLNDHANVIEKAIFDTLAEGKSITGDLGGKASTSDYTRAIIDKIKK